MPRTTTKSEVKVNNLKANIIEINKSTFSRREKIELEMKIRRMFELEAAAKEYNKIREDLKKRFENVHNVKFGEFLVTGEVRDRKGYVVQDSSYWNMKIIKV